MTFYEGLVLFAKALLVTTGVMVPIYILIKELIKYRMNCQLKIKAKVLGAIGEVMEKQAGKLTDILEQMKKKEENK